MIAIHRITGNISGLRPLQLKQLKRLALKRLTEDVIVSQDIARSMTSLSFALRRQIGILINRSGHISHVILGDHRSVEIPELERNRSIRLRGLRLVHTHLYDERLNEEDLYDLTLLRLDYITAITIDDKGFPSCFYSAHILPGTQPGYCLEPACQSAKLFGSFSETITHLEVLFSKKNTFPKSAIQEREQSKTRLHKAVKPTRAVLVGVYTAAMRQKRTPRDSMQELQELCTTANIEVADIITQKRTSLDPISLVGSGKAKQIALCGVQRDAEMLVFDLELSPAQAKRLSQLCDLKIVDRTQLILDIFARNARSHDGKLQVELAQLRYLKERLSEKDDNMSRLTGGIGGRGPGETKLEIGKRRVNDRIQRLEKELLALRKRRTLNRSRRKNAMPTISIVGYTNAGKSTLLNALTSSSLLADSRLFATLDPTSRRLTFANGKSIILSDTVGFIHELPPELRRAFTATLEELADAQLLLHCIDASDPSRNHKIEAVQDILSEMQLGALPIIQVFNKCDLLTVEEIEFLAKQENTVCISAVQKQRLDALLSKIEGFIYEKETAFAMPALS